MNIIPIHFRPQQATPSIADGFGRKISYLRISVVDRCNLRCTYCRPNGDDFHAVEREQLLTFEEIERVVRMMTQLGVEKIRLTGGEPLVRKGLVDAIARIAAVPGIRDLALSTNAVLLDKFARPLREAGLHRVNISLDSLNPQTFEQLTGGRLNEVLAGIHAAQDAGFTPIRINAVLMRGINDHEAASLIDWSIREQLELRFIELMPMCEGMDWQRHYYPFSELLAQSAIIERLDLDTSLRQGSSAARYVSVRGMHEHPLRHTPSMVGFIEPMSNHFCESCNRLRLMSDGKLRPCLSADHEIDLRSALRDGCSDETLLDLIRLASTKKQEYSTYTFESIGRQRSMIAIGG
ncbi:MAG: GTP 3',8-cyclase MoaA [Betaproteobacteria bacterium]|nr:GTP 3',8-cyclase MoaA [Betaproteobacteria bacterium]